MEEHIKRYANISGNGNYQPPSMEKDKKEEKKMEPFDIIEPPKKNDNQVLQNQEVIPINNSKDNNEIIQNDQKPQNVQNGDIITQIKNYISPILENKTVSVIINPFQEESQACQLCYKIYSLITCIIVVLVILLSLFYS